MSTLQHYLKTLPGNGAELVLECWCPPQVRGAIALTHGLGEHPGRYQDLIHYFSRRQLATCGIHLRGHGHSGGRRGYCNSLDELVDDALQGIQATAHLTGQPLLLYGHSLGGLVLLKLLVTRGAELPDSARAAVVSGAAVRLGFRVPLWRIWGAKLFSQILPTLTLTSQARPELLSHDPKVTNPTSPDPLMHRQTSARLGVEIWRNGPLVAHLAPQITLPCLLIHGGEDLIADPRGSQQVAAALAGPKAIHIYPGMRHEPHNELGREQVFSDVAQWITRYVLTLPSSVLPVRN